MHFHSSSEEETAEIAARLVDERREALQERSLVFAVHGEMAAGKTRFAKGVGDALNVRGVVSSPSYVLTKEYVGSAGRLVHIDCWRTPEITPEELAIGGYLKPGTVVVVEWPKPLLPYLKQLGNQIELVELVMTGTGNDRDITGVS
jgi:tRNA threonylcarbamoyladenosine biosynthesis protein TsaE